MLESQSSSVLVLTGGVGGAKLCLGLADEVASSRLHLLVNTGDDFQHLGLHISPDVDTLMYTLSGRNNQKLGWGLASESWATMDALEQLGGDTWFRLGDKDIATHLLRTQMLGSGSSLSDTIHTLASRMGITCPIYPMTDDSVRTTVCTAEGELPFQHYFVRRQCQPAVSDFRFDGIESAQPNPALMQLLAENPPAVVIISPSNPFVSVDPILQLPGMWQALRDSGARVIAVSPIVAGLAIKGPAAKMMQELKLPVSALAVASYYSERYPELVSDFIIDRSDVALQADITKTGMNVAVTDTIMKTRQDKQNLARYILNMAGWV